MRLSHLSLLARFVALGATLVSTTPVASQTGGEGYLFGEPGAILTVKGGLARPSAGGDLFAFMTDLFTLERDDFSAFSLGGAVSFPVNERVALGVSASYAARTTHSEYRDWVDQDDLPIEQETNFVRLPLLATAKVYLLPRGETIGSLAWIPSPYAPYVGIGAGALWHRFRIAGSMFDYDDPEMEIYYSQLEDFGWSPAVQALAGVDISLTPRLMVTGEANYIWSNAELGQNFTDFEEPLDLSGFTGALGLSFRL